MNDNLQLLMVKTKSGNILDLQGVRKYMIAEGASVLDFDEISPSEVHYKVRKFNKDWKESIQELYGCTCEVYTHE